MYLILKKYGYEKWSFISEKMKEKISDESITAKQCRDRWHNHLCPKIKK
jgi:hypothetical protein